MPEQNQSNDLQENQNLGCDAVSEREAEILNQLSCGASNKTIADSLGITIHTVEKVV